MKVILRIFRGFSLEKPFRLISYFSNIVKSGISVKYIPKIMTLQMVGLGKVGTKDLKGLRNSEKGSLVMKVGQYC